MVLLVNYSESTLQLFSSYSFLFSTKTLYCVFNVFFSTHSVSTKDICMKFNLLH